MHGYLLCLPACFALLLACVCHRLDNALQEFMKDFADRMKEINTSLSSSSSADAADSSTLAEKEALCDELIEIVENVDYARGE